MKQKEVKTMYSEKLSKIIIKSIMAKDLSESEQSSVTIDELYLVNSNEIYRGYFYTADEGQHYNNILLIGYSIKTEKYYFLSDTWSDVLILQIFGHDKINIDIPAELNCFRLFGFHNPYTIKLIQSTIWLSNEEREEKEVE